MDLVVTKWAGLRLVQTSLSLAWFSGLDVLCGNEGKCLRLDCYPCILPSKLTKFSWFRPNRLGLQMDTSPFGYWPKNVKH